jgi:hypothetical protein
MAKQHGIPTVYRGVQYRSRLEARWAAFFDLMGWKYQYEPFDLNGWIPDFILGSGTRSILVEIKPILPVYDHPVDITEKIDCSDDEHEVLILGCSIDFDHEIVPPVIGWARVDFGDKSHAAARGCGGPGSWGWDIAFISAWDETFGITSCFGSHWYNKIGFGEKEQSHSRYDWDTCSAKVKVIWNQAGNLVQWRGKQSITGR